MPKYCTACGAPLTETCRFCVKCGKPVPGRAQSGAAERRPAAEPPPVRRTDFKDTPLGEMEYAQAYFSRRAKDYDTLAEITRQIEQSPKPATGGSILWGGIIFGAAVLVIGAMLGISGPGFIDTLLFILLIVAGIICVCGIVKAGGGNKSIKQWEAQMAALHGEAERKRSELMAYYALYPDCPVGFEYSAPAMLELLIGYIRNGRAGNAKEALNCYITDMHNNEMLAAQKETAQNAQKAASSAQSAAMFTAASYLNTNRRK